MATARRDGALRRDALLDAALECFVERGVLSTGIEEIRRAAGASPSSVYHLFDGLPGLIAALLQRTFERLFAHLGARVKRAKTAEETVHAIVDGHLEWVFKNRPEARVMYQAMTLELAGPKTAALQEAKARLLEPIAAHVAAFVAKGELPAWPTTLFDVVLLGPSHEACRRFLGGAALDARWMRVTFPRLAWQSIANEVPATAKPRRTTKRRV